MKTIRRAMSLAAIVVFSHFAHADEVLLYSRHQTQSTTLHAYSLATHGSRQIFSDKNVSVALQPRAGASDCTGVIRASGGRIFAIGKLKSDPSANPALYEVLFSSGAVKKIADVDSSLPIELLAVDSSAQKIGYVSRVPDQAATTSADEVGDIVIHDLTSGKQLNQFPPPTAMGAVSISYFDWSASTSGFTVEATAEQSRRVYHVDEEGDFAPFPIEPVQARQLSGQFANGDLLFTYAGSTDIDIYTPEGKLKKSSSFQAQRQGRAFALSDSGLWLAVQSASGELWIKNLDNGSEQSIPLQGEGRAGLIGWSRL